MMKAERDKERIKEFFDLTDTAYNLRKYHKPVLVYDVKGDKVRYSLWEEDILQRFGLENVDGWDATEDLIFCPDWMQGKDEDEDLEDIEIDDDDLKL
ncbi:MAG: hypothetical protein JXB60_03065 [Candidatus Cloacimonetes bacterium]|nr:hypothetical protein [Candidatus Cloacimonadota bacterium]